ncbi:MAG: chemotaxis protein CheC [Vampirovibrionia bacterium]
MSQIVMNDMKLDAIRELVNISSGNAATALAQMTSKKVDLDVPSVRYMDIMRIPDMIGGLEELMTCVAVITKGDINGFLVFIIDNESYLKLADVVSGGMDISPESVVAEVVNIINGSYLAALGEMLDFTIDVSPPETITSMMGSILSTFVSQLSMTTEDGILISSNLFVGDTRFKGYQLFLMEEDSLKMLLAKLKEKYNV